MQGVQLGRRGIWGEERGGGRHCPSTLQVQRMCCMAHAHETHTHETHARARDTHTLTHETPSLLPPSPLLPPHQLRAEVVAAYGVGEDTAGEVGRLLGDLAAARARGEAAAREAEARGVQVELLTQQLAEVCVSVCLCLCVYMCAQRERGLQGFAQPVGAGAGAGAGDVRQMCRVGMGVLADLHACW